MLGSVNADHVLQVPSFPRPGETLHGHNYQVIPGGKGANQAVAASRLKADIGFIASIGDDAFGKRILEQYADDGIDISGISVQTGSPTGMAMIQVSGTGENSICLSAEANTGLTSEVVDIQHEKISHAECLLMQLETPIDGVVSAAGLASMSGTAVVLNPAPARTLPDELLTCIDIITPNETEAEQLTGITVSDETSAASAASYLHNKGIGTVLITLGANGVYASQQGQGKIIPGFSVDVVDTTAAGDTFNGALVTGLIEGMDFDKAVLFANAAAAISVTRLGAQTSIPTRDEVEAFLSQHADQ